MDKITIKVVYDGDDGHATYIHKNGNVHNYHFYYDGYTGTKYTEITSMFDFLEIPYFLVIEE